MASDFQCDKYIPRWADARIEELLKDYGAVSMIGPKWCGKTNSALRLAKSAVSLMEGSKAATVRGQRDFVLRG